MRTRKTLDKWIDEAISDKSFDGQCRMLALVHMVGSQPKELHTTKFTGGMSWTAKDLADLYRDKAETYAQDLQGVQMFQLLAFYGDSGQAQAFLPFAINPQADGGFGLGTEQPTEAGRLQQKMRIDDALIGQVYRRQGVMDDHAIMFIREMSVTMRDMARANKELMQENRDAFNIVKDVLMTQASNTHKFEMEKKNYERATIERKKWLSFLPPLVNSVLGREIFPAGIEDTALLEGIADGIEEKDLMTLAQVIKPEMLGPLMARLERYQKNKVTENEQIKALAEIKVPNPENDAGGGS